ncbi:putative repeat protein (TIGR01451 family) [Haloactinopolyspora alba]|uniref:Putative repeat protein (TIGR01451 family) n=1 Tax=Haloactinopolyspora alba TaxID=648780 RepID=A0A2P8E156_9ACTN|nr:S8 family serine peptidase [Haloactinopolyspora alba]PSL03147.1 putative repeat protein (TIGR01451 family) [Haloactinopolyspora alba]
MLRRSLTFSAVAALTLGLAQGAAAAPPDPPFPDTPTEVTDVVERQLDKGPVMALGSATERPELYLVRLKEPAVPSYDGGIDGIPATAPEARGTQRLDADADAPRQYREHLRQEQAELVTAIGDETGRSPDVRHTYTDAMNGIAVELTRDEARAVAELPGVAAVQVDEQRELQTDHGPDWIGAPALWDGSGTPGGTSATKGEGVVVGVLDSGINPANPSFADSVPEAEGGDGYDHTNPLGSGTYVGVCDPANTDIHVPDFGCNDKLIGAWSFTSGEPGSPYDDNGHGSHTASTSAGNQVEATTYSARGTEHEFSATRTISGVAPHANLIAYDVCTTDGCSIAGIVAAIDQAIADGVDVINYSIGSSSPSAAWTDPDAVGFLNARAAGVHVATSAGNDGPGANTVGSPADVPWVTSVGAAQHDRQWQAEINGIAADGGETLPAIRGLGFSAPTGGAFDLIYAGDLGSPLCKADGLAGQDLTGKIVVCDRGEIARVAKGGNLAALGAEGMVLANDEANGSSLNADAHELPAVHITHADGVALKEWMAGVTGEQAALSGGIEVISDELGDVMAGFSSRGPNNALDIVSPSVTAPGVDILAAGGAGNEVAWEFISGTSMASPHVAGSFALLKGVHGDAWSPAEAQSALMTTAHTDVTDIDGTAADWHDMGSGRVDLNVAARAGLVMDETYADYVAADPAQGGDVKTLNLPSMANSQCLQTCTFTRTVTGTATGAGTWAASAESTTDGVTVSVEPSTFTIAEGEDVELTVTVDVTGAATEDYQYATVVLTPPDGSAAPPAHLPVAVLPSTGVLPGEISVDTRRDAGSQESAPIEAIEITDLTTSVAGLVPAAEDEVSVPEDSTNDDPYDGNGTHTTLIEVPADGARLIASLSDATAPDMDLFVGTGSEPSAATEVCSSTSSTADEFCDITDPEAGTWWVVAQNWEASAAGGTDTVTLGTAVVGGDAGNMTVDGPQQQPIGEPFTIRTSYDEPAMEAGQTWYGAVTLGSSPDSPGDIGTLPVTVHRHADDVTKTASVDTAAPGETVTYTLTVRPNVTPRDLSYTISDTLPEGMTYVEGSATGGATVTDGVLEWEGTMPTPVGAPGSYDITTSADDETCVNPFTGTAGYTNLEEFGIPANAGISGDGVAYTAFAGTGFGFHGDLYDGLGFTDDGFLSYDVAANYGGQPGTPQSLPDPARPNNVAAMLWQDMRIDHDADANTGVSLATAGDLAIVEYDDVRLADDPDGTQGTYDVEAFAVAGSSDLVFAYDNVTGPLSGPLTVGTENADGTAGTALVDNGSAEGVITDGTVVCADYAGPDLEPVRISYDVTVDDDVADGRVLTNEAVHVTDNPGAQPVTAAADVTVDTPAVTVSATQDAVEPDTDGVVTFTRPAGAAGGELTVSYSVTDSRYTRPGRDYEPLDGEVTFPAGETTVTETVGVIDRRGPSPRERSVEITVDPGSGYQVGDPATASIGIVSDGRAGRGGR